MYRLKNKIKTDLQRYREQTDGFQRGGGGDGEIDRGDLQLRTFSCKINESWRCMKWNT